MAREPGIRSDLYNLGAETESAFNTKNGGASFPNVQAWNCSHALTQAALEDSTQRSERGANPPIVGSMRDSTLGFDIYCTGLQTAAGEDVPAGTTVHSPLWAAAVGTEVRSTGTTYVHAGSTTSIPVIAKSFIGEGQAVAFEVGDNIEVRWVIGVAAGTGGTTRKLILDQALSAAPSDGTDVYAASTYSFSGTGPTNTLQFRQVNMSTESDWEAYGVGIDSWSLNAATPGDVFAASFSGKVASFTFDESTVTNAQPSAPVLLTKSPWMASQCSLYPYSASTVAYAAGNQLPVKSFSAEHALGIAARLDPNAEDGIGGWNPGGDPVGTISLTTVMDDQWTTYWQQSEEGAQQYFRMLVTCGSVAGRIWGVVYPKVHLTEEPQMMDDGGILATSLSLAVSSDAGSPGLAVFML